jgi:hypothetical protein
MNIFFYISTNYILTYIRIKRVNFIYAFDKDRVIALQVMSKPVCPCNPKKTLQEEQTDDKLSSFFLVLMSIQSHDLDLRVKLKVSSTPTKTFSELPENMTFFLGLRFRIF